MRVLFCAGAGRIRTGRPSADGKKQSCGLFFRPRLANPPAPTKKLWQRYCRSFFCLLYRTKSAKAMTDFHSAFYRDVQLLPGGWIFLLPTFSAAFRMLRQYHIILSADTASEVRQPPERCLSVRRKLCGIALNFPAAGDRGVVHAHPVKSETGHRITAGTCNPGGKQV